MSKERVLQLATLAAFGVVVVMAVRLFTRDDPVKTPEPQPGSVTVLDAIAVGQEQEIAVSGYLFEGAGWPMRLCNARESGDPPRCIGPFLYVEQLDPGRFNAKAGRTEDGEQRWVPEPVTLLGRLKGTELTVREVLTAPQ